MMDGWRRLIPGAKHEPARSIGVFGRPSRPDPASLAEMLGTCEQLRTWARTHAGFELGNIPADLPLLDSAFDQATERAGNELGGPSQIGLLASQAGLYLGTVIARTVAGARWRLWPNGHPVLRLPSGRDLDVVAIAIERVSMGSPLLADAYADATADPLR